MTKYQLAGQNKKQNFSARSAKQKNRFGTLNSLLIATLIVAGVGYLVQVNSLATKGYQIRELENKIYELELQKSELSTAALELQSVANVKTKVQELDMVVVGEAEYVGAKPVAVAR